MKCKWEIATRVESSLRTVREFRSRFGTAKTLQHVVFRLVNRVVHFDCLHIMILSRESLRPLDPAKTSRFSTKIATFKDLKQMIGQGCWRLPDNAVKYFDRGDTCLSCVDNNLAGYV